MAIKPLIILEKQSGATAEISVITSRLSSPTFVEPYYTYDVSVIEYLVDLKDVSVKTPLNDQVLTYETTTSLWKNKSSLDLSTGFYSIIDLSTYDIKKYFYTKSEIDALLDSIVGGTY